MDHRSNRRNVRNYLSPDQHPAILHPPTARSRANNAAVYCGRVSDSYVPPSNIVSRSGSGIVGGIAGGLVLAGVLTYIDHIRPVGQLVGNDSRQVAWTVLLVLAAIAGCLYGAFVGRAVTGQIISSIGIGIFYGGIWWIVLELVAIPLRSGGSVFTFVDDSMLILAAYVGFGIVLGIVYAIAGPRRRYQQGRPRWRDSRPYQYMYQMPQRARRRRRRTS